VEDFQASALKPATRVHPHAARHVLTRLHCCQLDTVNEANQKATRARTRPRELRAPSDGGVTKPSAGNIRDDGKESLGLKPVMFGCDCDRPNAQTQQ
jgi:hypothetical protein